ncbi:hemicentin-1, partial [Biomphalaria glabrata]
RSDAWTLVFKAQSRINVSFYNLWEMTGYQDDPPSTVDFPVECFRFDKWGSCTRHYRSSVLDNWLGYGQVKVAFLNNGHEVAFMIFSGVSTNRQSWFNQTRVATSWWTSLWNDTSLMNYFTFTGFTNGGNRRRMSILSANSCHINMMYFMVLDTDYDECSSNWSLPLSSYPVFLYSPMNAQAKLNSQPPEYREADTMVIWVM